MITKFIDSIVTLDSERATKLCKELLNSPRVEVTEVFGAVGSALDIIGEKYEVREYYLSELIMAGDIIKEVLQLIEPLYEKEEQGVIATVVLATVRGDLHDLGKKILGILLHASGFKVIDLGIDMSAENIVNAVQQSNAQIVGLSTLLTTTVYEFANVITELKQTGLRSKVKVIVGGAAVTQEIAENYGVDSWAATDFEGVTICKQWCRQEGR